MQHMISVIGAGLLAATLALPAHAAIYSTTFSGAVSGQQGTTYAVGSTVAGSFAYSSDVGRFLSFSIDGFSASGNYNSLVSTTPGVNPYSAIFSAQISAVSQGGQRNQSFTLDLEALNTFSPSTALGILTASNLNSQLDPTLSQFTYYSANANGTGVVSLTAALARVSTNVPEPTSLVLLALPLTGLFLRPRR